MGTLTTGLAMRHRLSAVHPRPLANAQHGMPSYVVIDRAALYACRTNDTRQSYMRQSGHSPAGRLTALRRRRIARISPTRWHILLRRYPMLATHPRRDVAARAAQTGTVKLSAKTRISRQGRAQNGGQNKRDSGRGKQKMGKRPQTVDLDSLDFVDADAKLLEGVYSSLCAEARLDDALFVLKQSIRAGREDALRMFKHFEFLRCAAKMKSVFHGMRFVQLFPRKYVDARTYNMLVSVCTETGDVKQAMRCADMLKMSGIKMDTILYTNLIKVCARAADAEVAFDIYKDMLASGVKVEKHVYATMLKACAAQIVVLNHEADRRNQLVLLERAFELVASMEDMHVRPDVAVWNALISVAARAEKLQRAFDVLDEMMQRGDKPNGRTYTALIDACARAGEKDLAIRLYHRAINEGYDDVLPIYSATINACVKCSSGVDVVSAMEIFADLQRAGVQPDSPLYGCLIMAAGRGGKLDLVETLYDEMLSDGLVPCIGTESALITVYVANGELDKAEEIYKRMTSKGQPPHMHAYNSLINSEAKAMKLGNVIALVRDMMSFGMEPDDFTFTAILNACQHSKQSELALEIYRVMRMRNIRIDDVHALLLLKICYSELRQLWDAAATGGAHNSFAPAGISRTREKMELISVLSPPGQVVVPKDSSSSVPWQSHACQIYRDALSVGVKPSLPVLNMALMCLKVPLYAARGHGSPSEDLATQTLQLHAGWQPNLAQKTQMSQFAEVQGKIGIDGIYHVQALSFMEDAIVGGLLPAITVDSSEVYDLQDYPPAVAEVYVLLLLQASQRQVIETRRYLKRDIKFIVTPYDRKKVFLPSCEVEDEDVRFRQELSQRYEKIVADSPNLPPEFRTLFGSGEDRPEHRPSGSSTANTGGNPEATSMGVAAVLRRLRIGAKESGSKGMITVDAQDVARWAKRLQNEIERRSASALALQKPYGQSTNASPGLQRTAHPLRGHRLKGIL
jgi:pentatricopeptide repeat protein